MCTPWSQMCVEVQIHSFLFSALVVGKWLAPRLGPFTSVATGQVAGWTPKLVCKVWKRIILLPLPGIEPRIVKHTAKSLEQLRFWNEVWLRNLKCFSKMITSNTLLKFNCLTIYKATLLQRSVTYCICGIWRTALFLAITQRVVVIPLRRLETTYWSHLKGSKIPRITTTCWIISQKSTDLTYFQAEAWHYA